jgi:hypothetical protein
MKWRTGTILLSRYDDIQSMWQLWASEERYHGRELLCNQCFRKDSTLYYKRQCFQLWVIQSWLVEPCYHMSVSSQQLLMWLWHLLNCDRLRGLLKLDRCSIIVLLCSTLGLGKFTTFLRIQNGPRILRKMRFPSRFLQCSNFQASFGYFEILWKQQWCSELMADRLQSFSHLFQNLWIPQLRQSLKWCCVRRVNNSRTEYQQPHNNWLLNRKGQSLLRLGHRR